MSLAGQARHHVPDLHSGFAQIWQDSLLQETSGYLAWLSLCTTTQVLSGNDHVAWGLAQDCQVLSQGNCLHRALRAHRVTALLVQLYTHQPVTRSPCRCRANLIGIWLRRYSSD